MANTRAEREQAEYLDRLRLVLRRAPAAIREDALREVQTHIEDEWRALGGDDQAMQEVLQRLGPPEDYGRDLAVQLMLLRGRKKHAPLQTTLAILFWAGTSLFGAPLVLSAALTVAFTLGMLVVAVERMRGFQIMLIDATQSQLLGYQAEHFRFPPESWSPLAIALAGLLPAAIVFGGLYRFLSRWVRSRLAERGLALIGRDPAPLRAPGWERRALLAMLGFALIGLTSCAVFAVLSGLLPVGRAGSVSLPADFFESPATLLAFIGGLIFLSAPVLGLLWMARRER